MKKIILVLMSLCVFAAMSGCNKTPDKKVDGRGMMGSGNTPRPAPGHNVGGL